MSYETGGRPKRGWFLRGLASMRGAWVSLGGTRAVWVWVWVWVRVRVWVEVGGCGGRRRGASGRPQSWHKPCLGGRLMMDRNE